VVNVVLPEAVRLKGHRWLGALALACLFSLVCVTRAWAQPEPPSGVVVHEVTQADLDGDGLPDRTDIRCNFVRGNDLVQVYDGARDMPSSADWQQATDFQNDAWVFDAGADGRAELIIAFTTDINHHMATLYDDRNGDGQVKYTVRGKRVVVEESSFWTAEVVADGPWYNADGSINRNVTISVDGALGERSLDSTFVQELMVNDGRVDLEMECHTGTWQSMSGYCLTRLLVPFRGGIARTKLRVVMPGEPLPEIVGPVFWPHLGPGLIQPRSRHEIVPALKLNWSTARFDRAQGVNNLLLPDPPAQNAWWALSQAPVIKGQINVLDFENPFAHYDVAGDHDDSPALVIRHTYSPPGYVWYQVGERYVTATDPRLTLQIVRYTWDQDNDGYWEYKLGLFGQNEVTSTVSFPDFDIISIPYDRLPWVLTDEPRWAGVTFVQVEGQAEASPEGVYEWDDIYWLTRQRIFGIGDRMDEGMNDIGTHFRGDYWAGAPQQARLYLSAVDHKLHLLGAEAGVWNVDGSRRIRYEDMDEDGYVDRWVMTIQPTEEAPEEPVMSLQTARGVLVYGGGDHVKLLRQQVAPSLFETLPPRDHAEWQTLGEALERNRRDFGSLDLGDMLDQFGGPATEIAGAELDDFRLTEDGFRFVLELQPGFQVIDDTNRLDVNDLTDGSYLVTHNGEFQVRPLTAPHLIVPQGAIATEPRYPQQGGWSTIRVVVFNSGLQDATSVPIGVYAVHGEEEPFLVGEEELFVPGEGDGVLEFAWWPVEAGEWTLSVEVNPNEEVSNGYRFEQVADLAVHVESANFPTMFRPSEPYDQVSFTWPVFTMLIAACVVALCVLWLVVGQTWKTTGSGEGK